MIFRKQNRKMLLIGIVGLVLTVVFAIANVNPFGDVTATDNLSPGTIYVDDDADPGWYDATHVKTIQEGIDNASSGDTVFVYNGTYYENVVVNKTVDLIGEDRDSTIIDSGGGGYGIRIEVDCMITNFTITNSTANGIWGTGNSTIHMCTISENDGGGIIWWYSSPKITNNIIRENGAEGIGFYSYKHGKQCYTPFIVGNAISGNNGNGIMVGWTTYHPTIRGNTIANNTGTGIHIAGAVNCSIYHNNIVNNTQQAYDNGNNTWYNATLQEGNYWSDFDEPSEGAYDNNSDGIVDSPYDIPGGSNQDLYPLMNPWGGNVSLDHFGVKLEAASTAGGSDSAKFGAADNATDGFDPYWDRPQPPGGSPPYVYAYFWYPDNPEYFKKLSWSYVNLTDSMTWPLRIELSTGANVTVEWNMTDIGNWPSEYTITLETPDGDIDMRANSNYTYEDLSTGNHDFDINASIETEPPEIADVQANPSLQEIGKWVNITCNVTDNVKVDTVNVNITYPNGNCTNVTMTNIIGTNNYYYNTTYSIPGTYHYFIWANDTSGNKNTSAIHEFEITSPPTIDYTLITYIIGIEIQNQTISTNSTIDGYVSAYNNTEGYLGPISVNWSVTNTSSNATTSPASGTSSTFYSGWKNGTAIWKADDGNGHIDTVTFTVNSSIASYIFIVYEGWNLITIPVENNFTAKSLIENISGCQIVCCWDSLAQQYKCFTIHSPPSYNFDIENGMGYFIGVTEDSIYSVTGILISNVSINLYEGWNLIGWSNDKPTTAKSLMENITSCLIVCCWDAIDQQYNCFTIHSPPSYDFPIEKGTGIFVGVTQESQWHGEG